MSTISSSSASHIPFSQKWTQAGYTETLRSEANRIFTYQVTKDKGATLCCEATFIVYKSRKQREMFISGLYVFKPFRGKGLARRALYIIAKQAQAQRIPKLTLDDMSDNYRNEHNLYLKSGFHYLIHDGFDMSARAVTVSRKTKNSLVNSEL